MTRCRLSSLCSSHGLITRLHADDSLSPQLALLVISRFGRLGIRVVSLATTFRSSARRTPRHDTLPLDGAWSERHCSTRNGSLPRSRSWPRLQHRCYDDTSVHIRRGICRWMAEARVCIYYWQGGCIWSIL